MQKLVKEAMSRERGATVFGIMCVTLNARRGGVAANRKATSIEEKPQAPKSNYAVAELYFYDNDVVGIAREVRPSLWELEITDVNNGYLKCVDLHVELLDRGVAWLDTGTHDSLLDAGSFVQAVETRQGLKIACLEEIAWCRGYIASENVCALAEPMVKAYGQYLLELVKGGLGQWW